MSETNLGWETVMTRPRPTSGGDLVTTRSRPTQGGRHNHDSAEANPGWETH
jgi:hypothetical protein